MRLGYTRRSCPESVLVRLPAYAEEHTRAVGPFECVDHRWVEAYLDGCRDCRVEMSIMQTACSGKFSSDRTIGQYAEEIWGVEAVPVSLHGPTAAR